MVVEDGATGVESAVVIVVADTAEAVADMVKASASARVSLAGT
jgi:hypothetical protein